MLRNVGAVVGMVVNLAIVQVGTAFFLTRSRPAHDGNGSDDANQGGYGNAAIRHRTRNS